MKNIVLLSANEFFPGIIKTRKFYRIFIYEYDGRIADQITIAPDGSHGYSHVVGALHDDQLAMAREFLTFLRANPDKRLINAVEEID